MPFDSTKPNLGQTYGDAQKSTAENFVALNAAAEEHKADASAHGLPALQAAAVAAYSHAVNGDAHNLAPVRAGIAALQTEVTAARGVKSSVSARLDSAINADGSIRLSTLNNKWINNSDTPTFLALNKFSVPGDRTRVYIGGAQLRFNTNIGYVYAPVASAVFAGESTVITLDPAYPVLSAAILSVDIGLIAWDNSVALSCTQNAVDIMDVQGQLTQQKGKLDSDIFVLNNLVNKMIAESRKFASVRINSALSRGCLIKTGISKGSAWQLEISGWTFSYQLPIDLNVYGNEDFGFIGGVSGGLALNNVHVFFLEGKICFWFPQEYMWYSLNVFVISMAESGPKLNYVASIHDAPKPSDITNDTDLSLRLKQFALT